MQVERPEGKGPRILPAALGDQGGAGLWAPVSGAGPDPGVGGTDAGIVPTTERPGPHSRPETVLSVGSLSRSPPFVLSFDGAEARVPKNHGHEWVA